MLLLRLNQYSSTSPTSAASPKIDGSFAGEYRSEVKVRDVIRILEDDGWVHVRTKGSHRQYKHPLKRGVVTIPGKPGDDLAPGTLNSVFKQAGLK
jgi:predicted RNA binding protein YcfA (HicA-like mRNA interferase family)